jgi:hypothetical protein
MRPQYFLKERLPKKPRNLLHTTVPRTKKAVCRLGKILEPTKLISISTGVKAPLTKAPAVQSPRVKNEDILHETIKDYLQSQTIIILKPREM